MKNTAATKPTRLGVRVDNAQLLALTKRALSDGVQMSDVIRAALDQYLSKGRLKSFDTSPN